MHERTARGWDVVAEAKYRAEVDEHMEILRDGGHNLLEPELRTVGDLIPGARVAHLQCSHGLDALGFLNLGAASVVGVDISSRMIDQAREKAQAFRPERSRFICADVLELPRELDRTEGLFGGTSSGANVLAAIRVAERLGRGARVATLLPDSGLKYLNTDVYRGGSG